MKLFKFIFIITLALSLFYTGFIFGIIHSPYKINNVPAEKEMPSSPVKKVESFINKAFGTNAIERISPQDRISEDQIRVYPDRVVINLPNAQWASFTDTNSMDPIIDIGANAIQIIPKSTEEIHIGDIVSYQSSLVNSIIIHRVIHIDYDEEGWYAILKGDNLANPDPEKVRFDQIKRITVAIIY
jgi:hypothetical protein